MKLRTPAFANWFLAGGATIAALAYAGRTRGYDKVHPTLRSPAWRVRTPSFGKVALALIRAKGIQATRCVEGVSFETRHIASQDGTELTLYLYRPRHLVDSAAAMLYTHGGGMIFGSAAGIMKMSRVMPVTSELSSSASNTGWH